MREKDCQHLSKLESDRVERMIIRNEFYRDWIGEGKNKMGIWGKKYLKAKVKDLYVADGHDGSE